MFSRFALFKLYIIIILLLLGIVYACPNFYKNTFLIKISLIKNYSYHYSPKKHILDVVNVLKNKHLNYVKLEVKDRSVFLHFKNINSQLEAFEVLNKTSLCKTSVISLCSNTSFPKFFSIFGAKPILLGLDLQGGTRFLLQVNTNNVFEIHRLSIIKYFLSYFSKNNYNNVQIKPISNYGIEFSSPNSYLLDKIKYESNVKRFNLICNRKSQYVLSANFSKTYLTSIIQSVIEKNIYILKNRIHHLGISEPIVHQQGVNFIAVELPGLENNIQVREVLKNNVSIEFHLVNNSVDTRAIRSNNYITNDSKLYRMDNVLVLLYKRPFMTGDYITDANYIVNDLNQILVNVKLNRLGGKIMSEITKNNIGEHIAILSVEYTNDKTKSSNNNMLLYKKENIINIAKISSILDDSFQIIGIRDVSEAKKLSILLKTGSFISPVTIVEESIVGPSIGKKNIRNGILSCIISITLCLCVMIIRYRKSGLIAFIALMFNFLLILAIMSILPEMVLTMPGIASILLTLAFSIDANVLINERIREEINNNVYIREAVHKGYNRSYLSIFDANVTMLIISIVLYIVGTDVIKNFAITTIVGIFTSLFSSLFVTRTIVQVFYPDNKIRNLSI